MLLIMDVMIQNILLKLSFDILGVGFHQQVRILNSSTITYEELFGFFFFCAHGQFLLGMINCSVQYGKQ